MSDIAIGQKNKVEFKLVYDTVSTINFRYSNTFITPFGEHVNTMIPIKKYEGVPLKKTPSNFVYFNPSTQLKKLSIDERIIDNKLLFPAAIRYYVDTVNMNTSCSGENLSFSTLPIQLISDLYKPFYFSKGEVTNGEYQEFIKDVHDSIIRKYLGGDYIHITNIDTTVNWEKAINIEDTNVVNIMNKFLFKKEEERFYKRQTIRTDIFNYSLNGKVINIYPDTLAWIHDFEYSFNEPMTMLYFWHPVYKEYPVTGINYWQAKAFCDWKTKKLQKEWGKLNPDILVEVDLPSMAEREFAIKSSVHYDSDSSAAMYVFDNNFVTDLCFKAEDIRIKNKKAPLRAALYRNALTLGDLVLDGGLHTTPTRRKWEKDFPLIAAEHRNSQGIYCLANNVSEWTNHDYSQWGAIFAQRQKYLLSSKTKEDSIIYEIESCYNLRNDKNGKLVVGGNWLDERRSLQLGQNLDGAYAKRFLHPDSLRCTVGFRYVVHVKLKSDTIQYTKLLSWKDLSKDAKQLMNECNLWIVDTIIEDQITLRKKTNADTLYSVCDFFRSVCCDDFALNLNESKLKDAYEKSLSALRKSAFYSIDEPTILDGVYTPAPRDYFTEYLVARNEKGNFVLKKCSYCTHGFRSYQGKIY